MPGGLRVYQFISGAEAAKILAKQKILKPSTVKRMLGGHWPAYGGFGWFEQFTSFRIEGNLLVPYNSSNKPVPNTCFVLGLLDDVIEPYTVLLSKEFAHLPIDYFSLQGELRKRDGAIATPMLKLMLGGKWPYFHGFSFNEVDYYKIEKGQLTPCDMCGEAVPGPDFFLAMFNNALKPQTLLLPDDYQGVPIQYWDTHTQEQREAIEAA